MNAAQNECRGVRALIVATKRGNSRGAKGCRKVDCGTSNATGNSRRVSARRGYASVRSPRPMGVGGTRCLDGPHVVGARIGREGRRMVISNGQTATLRSSGCIHWNKPGTDPDNHFDVTTNRRAVCGRSARTVRREGRPVNRPSLPLSSLCRFLGRVAVIWFL